MTSGSPSDHLDCLAFSQIKELRVSVWQLDESDWEAASFPRQPAQGGEKVGVWPISPQMSPPHPEV